MSRFTIAIAAGFAVSASAFTPTPGRTRHIPWTRGWGTQLGSVAVETTDSNSIPPTPPPPAKTHFSIAQFSQDVPDSKVSIIPFNMEGREVLAPDAVWMTGAPQFWSQDLYGAGVTVGVIDSGIDHTHPSLDGRLDPSERRDYVSWENDVPSTEFNLHGTHVAGTIAANSRSDAKKALVGVAPKAKLRDYRVFDKWGFSICLKDPAKFAMNPELDVTQDDLCQPVQRTNIAQAVRDAVADGCNVINMSLGSPFPNFDVMRAIEEARRQGVAVIVAAGNEGAGKRSYPAAFPETLSVAAVNVKLPMGHVEQVWFSNDNSEVDVAADGYYVHSTVPGGNYANLMGTSMATPCVAGMAALLHESLRERFRRDGKPGMPDIHDLLRHRAVSVFDDDGRERNEVAGHGLCTFFSEVPAVTDGQWILPGLNNNKPRSVNES